MITRNFAEERAALNAKLKTARELVSQLEHDYAVLWGDEREAEKKTNRGTRINPAVKNLVAGFCILRGENLTFAFFVDGRATWTSRRWGGMFFSTREQAEETLKEILESDREYRARFRRGTR